MRKIYTFVTQNMRSCVVEGAKSRDWRLYELCVTVTQGWASSLLFFIALFFFFFFYFIFKEGIVW